MRILFIAILALAVLVPGVAGAKKQHHVPLPQPRTTAEDILARAQATNPDPFNVNRNQPQAAPTSTATTQPPIVVTVPTQPAQASTQQSLRDWVHTALYAFLTAIAGWLGIKLPSSLSGNKDDGQSKIKDVVSSLVHGSVIKDPDLKAKVDLALFQAVQSGVPGQLIQGGVSLIPGAAPFVTTLEPMLRKVVLNVLEERAKQVGGAVPSSAAPMPAAGPNIEDLLNKLAERLTNKPAEKAN